MIIKKIITNNGRKSKYGGKNGILFLINNAPIYSWMRYKKYDDIPILKKILFSKNDKAFGKYIKLKNSAAKIENLLCKEIQI